MKKNQILMVATSVALSSIMSQNKKENMSYDQCKYCSQPAFKSDGNAELICFNRAETGNCNTPPLKVKAHDGYDKKPERKRPVIDIKKEYELIQQKKSSLSRSDRDWVIEQFNK